MDEFLEIFKRRWAEKYPKLELSLSDAEIIRRIDDAMTISSAIMKAHKDLKERK